VITTHVSSSWPDIYLDRYFKLAFSYNASFDVDNRAREVLEEESAVVTMDSIEPIREGCDSLTQHSSMPAYIAMFSCWVCLGQFNLYSLEFDLVHM